MRQKVSSVYDMTTNSSYQQDNMKYNRMIQQRLAKTLENKIIQRENFSSCKKIIARDDLVVDLWHENMRKSRQYFVQRLLMKVVK